MIDMALFVKQGEAVWSENHRRQGDRLVRATNMTIRDERVQSIREMTPGYDRQQWRGRRFFDDWSASSAGRSGERICTRWVFRTSDYAEPNGHRDMDYVPAWTHTRKVAALRDTHRLDCYGLYEKLTKLDERVGAPFGWFGYVVTFKSGRTRVMRQKCIEERLTLANATSRALTGSPTDYLPEVPHDMRPKPPAPPVPIMDSDEPTTPVEDVLGWINDNWPGKIGGYVKAKL